MSKEERAEISRKNGAKSKGPVTPEGKEKVSQNALKTGEYAEKFPQFLPPHAAATCFEDRAGFDSMVADLMRLYAPQNDIARTVVRDIATARWQVERNNFCLTAAWNYASIEAHRQPTAVPPELVEVERTARATRAMLSGSAIAARLGRENARLQKHIMALEKHLLFVHKNFPVESGLGPAPLPADENNGNKPSIVTDVIDSEVLKAYRRDFPNHKIVIVPRQIGADDDELPDLRRKRS